jgi:hypothetical protein
MYAAPFPEIQTIVMGYLLTPMKISCFPAGFKDAPLVIIFLQIFDMSLGWQPEVVSLML